MSTAARNRQSDHASKQPHPSSKRRKGPDDAQLDPAELEKALKAYMHHAVRLVHKAVKKSKTFELQKLTRKLKSTREPKEGAVDAALLADLEAQLAALKKLDLDAIPTHLLTTRLPKLHSLRTSPPLLATLVASLPVPKTPWAAELDPRSAECKARNRVLAHKAVGEAWDEVSRAVRKRLGEEVDARGGGAKGKEKELAPPPPKKGITMDPGRQAQIEAAFLGGGDADGADEGDDGDESSEDEGPAEGVSEDEAASGDEDDEEDDDVAIQRELAALEEGVGSEGEWSGSEADRDDSENASVSSAAAPPANKAAKRRQPSLSPSPPPAKKARSAAPSKPITSSSFLPSLAAGYVSYSDSDGEDARWVKDLEREDKKGARKNRRGQRARQAIWEKKYGSAANHVVKSTGGTLVPIAKIKDDKAARAARRAARASGDTSAAAAAAVEPERRRREFAPPKADLGWKKRVEHRPATTAPGPGPGPGAAAAAGGAPAEKMHPSWEAKRKQSEALKHSASIQPQGKKITFA
ncbi:hypothetical protein JCM3770_002348 [Rhodotorula araucariae]